MLRPYINLGQNIGQTARNCAQSLSRGRGDSLRPAYVAGLIPTVISLNRSSTLPVIARPTWRPRASRSNFSELPLDCFRPRFARRRNDEERSSAGAAANLLPAEAAAPAKPRSATARPRCGTILVRFSINILSGVNIVSVLRFALYHLGVILIYGRYLAILYKAQQQGSYCLASDAL